MQAALAQLDLLAAAAADQFATHKRPLKRKSGEPKQPSKQSRAELERRKVVRQKRRVISAGNRIHSFESQSAEAGSLVCLGVVVDSNAPLAFTAPESLKQLLMGSFGAIKIVQEAVAAHQAGVPLTYAGTGIGVIERLMQPHLGVRPAG